MTQKDLTLLRTLTRAEARAEGLDVPGSGKVLEVRCDVTGQVRHVQATAWNSNQVGHRLCCGEPNKPKKPQTLPVQAVEASIYGIKGAFVSRLQSQPTLAGLWRRANPTSDLDGVRLDILLKSTEQVGTFDLSPKHIAVLNWWFRLEANPAVWVPPPDLENFEQVQTQEQAPPRIHNLDLSKPYPNVPILYLPGASYTRTYVDISTDPPTTLSKQLAAWLLLRWQEYSYSSPIPVPPTLWGDITAQEMATHGVRELRWPAPTQPYKGDIFEYVAPIPSSEYIPSVAVNGEPVRIDRTIDGTMRILRRPRPVEWLPQSLDKLPADWDVQNLVETQVPIPAHWEFLPYWA